MIGLAAVAPGGARVAITPLGTTPWLLAGGQRCWRLDGPGRLVRPGTVLQLSGTTEAGTLNASVTAG